MNTGNKGIIPAMLCLACIFFSGPAFAQAIQVVTEEYPPYYYSEKGTVLGFCTEVVEEVLNEPI